MWGTTSSCAEPIGNFRAAFEAISIDDCRYLSFFDELGVFGFVEGQNLKVWRRPWSARRATSHASTGR
jgi:hypothetical protein